MGRFIRVKQILFAIVTVSVTVLLNITEGYAQRKYTTQYITTENGLPSDGINAMQWDDSNNLLWISTELGLVRYDGNNFKIIDKNTLPTLKYKKIFPFTKDINNVIYGINNGNIYKINGNKIYYDNELNLHNTNRKSQLLAIYTHETEQSKLLFKVNDYSEIIPYKSNSCLIEIDDTLYQYTYSSKNVEYLFQLPKTRKEFKINGELFYLANHKEIYKVDVSNKKLLPISIDKSSSKQNGLPAYIKYLYWNSGMNNPIVLAEKNAWILNYNNGQISSVLICSSVPTNSSIKAIIYWKESKILFLGTTSKGVIVIRESSLEHYKKSDNDFNQTNAIYAQIPLANGNILTNSNIILGPYPNNPQHLPFHQPVDNFTYTNSNDILWYAVKDSIYSYNLKTHERKFISFQHNNGHHVFAESEKQMFLANKKGLFKIGDTGLQFIISLPEIGDAFQLIEYKKNTLALASLKGLYFIYLDSKSIETVFKSDAQVRALWIYKDYLFTGTYGDGIYLIKNNIIKKIPLDYNNNLLYTHCFFPDGRGFCWISSNRGLFKVKIDDIINAFENNTGYIYYHFFGVNEGMDITEMNGGCTPVAVQLKDSTISFPTMDGAVWIKPDAHMRMPSGNIYVDYISINGSKYLYSNSDSVFLKSNTHEINYRLTIPSWCNKENIYLEYKITPGNDVWNRISIDNPEIDIQDLPSGTFTVEIRQLKGFGKDNFTIKKLHFEIDSPWYMKWWGKSILLLAAAGIVTLISVISNTRSIRRQIKLRNLLDSKTQEILIQNEKLEKNDKIKTRLISIISHDIITPLRYMHMTSKFLLDQKEKLNQKMTEEWLGEVTNTSRELELLSTNILNWIKYQNEERRIIKEKFNLHELTENIFNILNSLAKKNNIELINDVDDTFEATQFVDPIRIIIYNLVVNALHFTQQGSISVHATRNGKTIEIEVRDTGLGMSSTQINNILSDHPIISSKNINNRSGNGLGFLIIKDLLRILNGKLHIESKPNKGTSVFIIFTSKQ